MAAGLSAYSRLDRLVHRIAFSAPAVQLAAADIEKTAYKARYKSASADRPIFITSLPRAGTTVLGSPPSNMCTRRDKVRIVSYEALCGDGPTVFRELCGQLGVGDAQAVARAGEIFRRGTDHAVSTDEVDEDLRMSSQALYADLGGL